jgi:hypothetical protein
VWSALFRFTRRNLAALSVHDLARLVWAVTEAANATPESLGVVRDIAEHIGQRPSARPGVDAPSEDELNEVDVATLLSAFARICTIDSVIHIAGGAAHGGRAATLAPPQSLLLKAVDAMTVLILHYLPLSEGLRRALSAGRDWWQLDSFSLDVSGWKYRETVRMQSLSSRANMRALLQAGYTFTARFRIAGPRRAGSRTPCPASIHDGPHDAPSAAVYPCYPAPAPRLWRPA